MKPIIPMIRGGILISLILVPFTKTEGFLDLEIISSNKTNLTNLLDMDKDMDKDMAKDLDMDNLNNKILG